MERIASFCINHDTIVPGMYISRVDFDDIVTYDVRFKHPNAGDFLTPESAHTIEHIFATYIRSIRDNVLYVGPMGCLTGFYVIMKGLDHKAAIDAVKEATHFTANFTGEIPGSKKEECGNYMMHDLDKAKKDAAEFYEAIKNWNNLEYPK